ncbi:hypothetical protein ACJVC5_00785 [Peredibacter sp. HCB2-198]|uniref:hypothetical protein n=1 Tax=Peredibacter sp. HCB2-198 TaxID=3383025 RepID=UPI0038B472AD
MKIKWSAFFSILTLATFVGCGSEQFGTTPQSSTSNPDAVKSFEQNSCSSYTLIKPKVDIIYMIDNTESYYYTSADLKNAITGTVNQVSSQFDFRIIAMPLVNPNLDLQSYNNSVADNSDFRVFTNSADALPSGVAGNKVATVSELTSFIPVLRQPHRERGLWRLKEFMKRHKGTGLLRQEAYNLVVIVSNNRDVEVENSDGTNNTPIQPAFDARYSELVSLKGQLQSKLLRIFSVTAHSACRPSEGWIPSTYSYIKMARAFNVSDAYDLCSESFTSIFNDVNSSIQQVIVPHTYRYWPITLIGNDSSMTNYSGLQVYKITSNGPQLVPSSSYTYYENSSTGSMNVLTTTNPSEYVSGRRHFIRFNSGAEITYPDCVQIRTTTKTEYFKYLVLQREPTPGTIYVTVNGIQVPENATDGWTYVGNKTTPTNIKANYPNPGDDQPAINKTGFMIQFNGVNRYYKSGDNVQVNFIPKGI